jgi:transposase
MKQYTQAQFHVDYPDDDACLDRLFYLRYANQACCPKCGVVNAQFYRVKGRRCYACVHCRHQLFPTANTVMHRSTVSLKLWFTALYLFSVSRNGVAALELERQLGVSHVTALRMARQIRKSMKQDGDWLSGNVEADEAYYGGRRRSSNRFSNKTPMLGVLERGGKARVEVLHDHATAKHVAQFLGNTVKAGSTLNTDESKLYDRVTKVYNRVLVKHSTYEFVRGDVYTNSLEGLWGRLKPSLTATHRAVSSRYLQFYVDEHVWKYNRRRLGPLYPMLLEAAAQPVSINR